LANALSGPRRRWVVIALGVAVLSLALGELAFRRARQRGCKTYTGDSAPSLGYVRCAAATLFGEVWFGTTWGAFRFAIPSEGTLAEWTRDEFYGYTTWRMERREEFEAAVDAIAHADGPVLADELSALLPLAGQAIYIQPFEMKQLAEAGLWD
jgi:hypothetical protein